MPPLIGITTSNYVNPATGWAYNRAYVPVVHAVTDAGGFPVLIPVSVGDDVLRGIYERLDGILLPGGGDVRPSLYRAAVHPATNNIDDARDHVEIQLAQWAAGDDLPLMGICRGNQVMNVAFGGTLIQDIPTEVETKLVHDITDGMPRDTLLHEVEIDPTSHLASILGATSWKVNSLHHQSVGQPGPNVCVTAHAPDGVVEGLEMPDKKFVLSVQWHPEDLYEHDPAMKRLFRAFVEAANGHPA
jgi:putative glutamine amidotransferase